METRTECYALYAYKKSSYFQCITLLISLIMMHTNADPSALGFKYDMLWFPVV